jgi:hypothetical protein
MNTNLTTHIQKNKRSSSLNENNHSTATTSYRRRRLTHSRAKRDSITCTPTQAHKRTKVQMSR